MKAGDCGSCARELIKENKYMSPEIVNKQISDGVVRVANTFEQHKDVQPSCFLIIANESTHVASREQFNLSLRWVNEVKTKLASFAFQTLLQIQHSGVEGSSYSVQSEQYYT